MAYSNQAHAEALEPSDLDPDVNGSDENGYKQE